MRNVYNTRVVNRGQHIDKFSYVHYAAPHTADFLFGSAFTPCKSPDTAKTAIAGCGISTEQGEQTGVDLLTDLVTSSRCRRLPAIFAFVSFSRLGKMLIA
jgi:hypothetical protein